MTLDNVSLEIIEKASKRLGLDIDKGAKAIDGFYKGVAHVIKTETTIIKIPFFGKFVYSEAWKQKKKAINTIKFSEMKVE